MLLVRVVPLALVLGCGLRGAEEPLPSIFAPKPVAPAPPPSMSRSVPTSERVSQALAERIREKAAALGTPTPLLAPDNPGEAPLALEKIVVLGEKVKVLDAPEKISATERFLRTGRFFETPRMHGDLRLVPVEKVGALPKDDVWIEVGVTIKF